LTAETIDRQTVQAFAREWVDAFNSHDLERILSHYAPDVTLTSPVAAARGHADGTVRGVDELRSYFAGGLASNPELRFDLKAAYGGVRSVVVHYQAVFGPGRSSWSAEMMELDGGLVTRVVAHYDPPPGAAKPEERQ
jgi:hypothetical protein